jgi:glycolate oxidase FAD binding subunit
MNADFAVDGVEPAEVVMPDSDEAVAEALASAREAGRAVIPVGGSTAVDIGNRPTRYDVALSTEQLVGIVEHSPGDLTVVVRAGTTIRALQEALAAHGQFVPLQPAYPDRATVGGTLAAATTYPWRAAFGAARDVTIGMRMALPNGTVARSGGKVVKNVAGYDLAKLFIGSYGTLGVITEVAFKVYPLPRIQRIARLPLPAHADIRALVRAVAALGPGVLSIALHLTRLDTTRTDAIVWIGGNERRVAELRDSLAAIALGADSRMEDADLDTGAWLRDFPGAAALRLASGASTLLAAVDVVQFDEAVIYPTIGAAYLQAQNVDPEEVVRARARLREHSGALTAFHVAQRVKETVDAWGDAGPDLALMRRVKRTFDPDSTMSPGRFVGGL